MKKVLIVFFFYLLLALVVFGKLPHTFFQQDEWAILGNQIYADKAGLSLFNRLFIYEQDTHLVPLGNLLTLIQYRLFGVHFSPYAWVAIGLHVLNAFLVFLLAKRLTQKFFLGALAGGIFLINSIPHQAVTWIATTTGTVGSTTALLLSLLFFTQQRFVRALFFFFLSLWLKETSIFVFLFYPVAWFILTKKKTFVEAVKFFSPLGILGLSYLLVRVYFLLTAPPSSAPVEALAQPPIDVYFFRALVLPVRVLSQSFLPLRFYLELARLLITLGYPKFVQGGSPDPYIVESVASDIITLVIAAAIIASAVYTSLLFLKRGQYQLPKVIFLSLLFIALSALPFIVVPGVAGFNALLDGRHLYLTDVFTSILMATLWWGLFSFLGTKKRAFGILLSLLLLGFSAYHIMKIRRDITYQVAIGDLRRTILMTITKSFPTLPQRTVFYVESDAPYYGLPYEEPIVPFQSGFGQVLLVWYNSHGQDLPACLFDKKYLYVLLEENFKECDGRGFGYFRKSDSFNRALSTYVFDPDSIIAFRFTSSTNILQDVTMETRETIRRFGHL